MRMLSALLLLLAGCGSSGGFRNDTGTNPNRDGGMTGGGGFVENRIDEGSTHGQGVQAVDIDADGDLDIVAAFSLTDSVHIYLNEGGGDMWSTVTVGAGIVAMEVEVEDLDGDGDLDIAAVGLFNPGGGRDFASPGEVTWFENPGDVRSSWVRHDITGFTFFAPLYVEAADLTGDGNLDLVVGAIFLGGAGGNGVHWFRNMGGGTFAAAQAIDADLPYVGAVQLHDVDQDGVTDVLAASREGSEIVWYENGRADGTPDPNPTFTRHSLAATDQPNDIQLANMDGDPELEVVATLTRGSGAIAYYDSPADPTQQWAEFEISSTFGAGESARLAIADFDGDQALDVAASSFMIGELRVYSNGTGGFSEVVVRQGYTGLNFITAGDIDGNGRTDIVTATYENSASDIIAWWANQP